LEQKEVPCSVFVLWAVTGISVLDPLPASAQRAHSFEELARQFRVGQIVIVTDTQDEHIVAECRAFPDDSSASSSANARTSAKPTCRIETEHRPIAKGAIVGDSNGVGVDAVSTSTMIAGHVAPAQQARSSHSAQSAQGSARHWGGHCASATSV
jgi:hypothetical protein